MSHRTEHHELKRKVERNKLLATAKDLLSQGGRVSHGKMSVKERTAEARLRTANKDQQNLLSPDDRTYFEGILLKFRFHEKLGFKAQGLLALLADKKLTAAKWAPHEEQILSWLES